MNSEAGVPEGSRVEQIACFDVKVCEALADILLLIHARHFPSHKPGQQESTLMTIGPVLGACWLIPDANAPAPGTICFLCF